MDSAPGVLLRSGLAPFPLPLMRHPHRILGVLVLLLGALWAAPAGTAAPVPMRVVSQTVGTDELLLALAEPAQVAALSHISRERDFSAVAAEAKQFPQIAAGDAETILKFSPTLVLFADYSRPDLVAQVKRTGVAVMVFGRYAKLEDAYANLRQLAPALGAEARAEKLIADCAARVAALRARLKGARPVRVLSPSTYGVIPGDESTFQDLCAYAVADNLAASLGKLRGHAAAPSEQMLSWPVEVIVVAGADAESALAPFRKLPPYQFMDAVKHGRAALLQPWQLSCVSHRRVDAYESLARQLHPEAFK